MKIIRDPEEAARNSYDLIIVGGGIYGAMLALEASLRERAVLLVEKEDFGGATSYNSLKTIHGGLRYLQALNLGRYRELVAERRWFLEHFPDLIKPLPVLMPLYGRGLRRKSAFRAAFLLDSVLSQRGGEAMERKQLPESRVIGPSEVKRLFPAVAHHHLQGGALWYDACMPDSQRLIMEVLRAACSLGATVLNYMPATDLVTQGDRVAGVRATDAIGGASHEYHAPVVVNATGPWSRENARRFDRDVPGLFRPSVAWNVLFDRAALSSHALAVAPPAPGGRVYFLHPWKGRLLAGTGHAPRGEGSPTPFPSREELGGFLADLNSAIPGLGVDQQDILHVYAGLLPVRSTGTIDLLKRDRLLDHEKQGGPGGLFSIVGTKFTTARSVAEQVVTRLFPHAPTGMERRLHRRTVQPGRPGLFDYAWMPDAFAAGERTHLLQIVDEEAVCHLDDLILRRTNLGDNPARALHVAPLLCTLFDWDDDRCHEEIGRLQRHYRWMPQASDVLA